jgi:hypothetical protein
LLVAAAAGRAQPRTLTACLPGPPALAQGKLVYLGLWGASLLFLLANILLVWQLVASYDASLAVGQQGQQEQEGQQEGQQQGQQQGQQMEQQGQGQQRETKKDQ